MDGCIWRLKKHDISWLFLQYIVTFYILHCKKTTLQDISVHHIYTLHPFFIWNFNDISFLFRHSVYWFKTLQIHLNGILKIRHLMISFKLCYNFTLFIWHFLLYTVYWNWVSLLHNTCYHQKKKEREGKNKKQKTKTKQNTVWKWQWLNSFKALKFFKTHPDDISSNIKCQVYNCFRKYKL